MTMTLPTIPTLEAGYVVQATDMNNLAYACTFLLTKPIARIYDGAGGQSISTSFASPTTIAFGSVSFDTDGMSGVTSNALVVATPGFYKVTYTINAWQSSGNCVSLQSAAFVITGSNNPAGAGVSTPTWPGYGAGGMAGNRICARGSGVIPWYMYAGDYVQVEGWQGGGTAQATTTNRFNSFLALEFVSA